MENKRMAMLVVMMLVMGNILIETEAITFPECYAGCVVVCGGSVKGALNKLECPLTCIKRCVVPKVTSDIIKELDQLTHYFCQLGCAADKCAYSTSVEDKDHVEKVSTCVDSCSKTCSHKKH
ncbi:Thionin-like protein 1 [Cardamine amara subsp. amara]|uniref:Thionin-like protein 1 n=1 Tax=Cardamine amara subsp. amara TaxID=228776 RepID=A0ABD0ZUC6_CARAN